MKVNNILIFLGVLLISSNGFAQIDSISLEQMHENEKIQLLLDTYKSYNEKRSDYRIQIFSGKLDQAQFIEAEAKEIYPDWPVHLDFQSPSFRVRIGAFKTRLIAEKNLIAVRKKYPGAVLLKPALK